MAHTHFLTQDEAQLIEDHLNWRDSEAQAKFRQMNLFGQNARTFPQVVVDLAERGHSFEKARWAAGQAKILVDLELEPKLTLTLAERLLEEREAA